MKFPAESVLTGTGMLFAAAALVPVLKDALKPLVSGGMAGATVVGVEARKRYSFLREELEDFVAEVTYEREQKKRIRITH